MSVHRLRMRPGRAFAVLACACCAAALFLAGAADAATRAWLDRTQVREGETVTLNIETDQPGVAPDFAPLQRDFTVGRPYRNEGPGRATLVGVRLVPRRSGLLEIPALRVGRELSQPLALQVGDAQQEERGQVFLQTRVDETSPWVQQSVGVTVRLYYATSLLSGELGQPAPDGASLQRVGDDVSGRERIGGREYQFVERRFLLVPERSGPLELPAPRFRGQAAPRFFDDFFGTDRALAADGKVQVLQVRPRPAGVPQPWLPLRGLQLRHLGQPGAARAGEAVEVVVEAKADGAIAAQFPELPVPRVEGAQVFAERAETTERFIDGRPQLTVVRRFAVVPQRAGRLVVPGQSVGWWDTVAGEARTARLPDLELDVAPGAVQARDPAAAVPHAGTAGGDDALPAPTAAVAGGAADVAPWRWLVLLLALLWLATLAWALRLRSRTRPAAPATASAHRAGRPSTAELRRALDAESFGEAVRLLQAMADPPAADLDEVIARLADPAQRDALQAMRRALWAGDGDPSSARVTLRAAFRDGPRWAGAAREAAGAPLPPLYPPARGG